MSEETSNKFTTLGIVGIVGLVGVVGLITLMNQGSQTAVPVNTASENTQRISSDTATGGLSESKAAKADANSKDIQNTVGNAADPGLPDVDIAEGITCDTPSSSCLGGDHYSCGSSITVITRDAESC